MDVLNYMELAYAGEHHESSAAVTRYRKSMKDLRKGKASRDGKIRRDEKACFICGKKDTGGEIVHSERPVYQRSWG